jgi:DNA-binding CsgD family transcriptional regulator
LLLAQVERRAKRRGAARDALLQAHALFSDAGAELWLPRVRDDLDRLGLEPGDRLRLTASEERIAGLAAGGATNREIASQLLISPKTVEATLARAYTKLQIRSRAQLGSALARVETGEESPGNS